MIVSGVAYSLLQWRYSSLICFILTFFRCPVVLFLFLFAIGFISLNYLLIVAAFDILKLIEIGLG